MPMLPITAFYGILLTLLLLILARSVVKARLKHSQGLGHTHKDVLIAGRNHGNATEYVPILLILLALAELNGASYTLLHSLGLMIIIARIMHAWGFTRSQGKHHIGRFWGTALTWLSMVLASVLNLLLIWPFLLRP